MANNNLFSGYFIVETPAWTHYIVIASKLLLLKISLKI